VLAVLAVILFAISFFEHGAGGHVSAWFSWQGTMLLGLAALALHLVSPSPWWPWKR
jgi:hypothetical protein